MTATEGKKRKVLIVSFYFPPANTAGALRVGKFAKYLPEFGWEPVVLTANEVDGIPQTMPLETDRAKIVRTPYFVVSSTLWRILVSRFAGGPPPRDGSVDTPLMEERRRKLGAIVRPVATLPLVDDLFFGPLGWWRPAVKAGLNLIEREEIEAIFSSCNPFVCHHIAAYLHRKTGVPWVAEFRDLWTFNHADRKIQPLQFFKGRIERATLRRCAGIATACEGDAKLMAQFHRKDVQVILNGFDDQDYRCEVAPSPKFRITYSGTLYVGRQDLTPLLEATAQLRREERIAPDDFEICFFGRDLPRILDPVVRRHQLGDLVKTHDVIPYRESIRKQRESSVLFTLEGDFDRRTEMYGAKVLEYLGAGRPILALATEGGAMDRLLQECGCGVAVQGARQLKHVLSQWLYEFREYGHIVTHFNPRPDNIGKYTRREQTRRLSALLGRACIR